MSLFDGILKINLAVTYRVDKGILAIKKGIVRSDKVTLNNIPISLLLELLPLLKGKDVSVNQKVADFNTSINDGIGDVFYHSAFIHASVGGEKMQFGCIVSPKKVFDIAWNERGIQDITGVEAHDCLKCDFRVNLFEFAEKQGGEVSIGTVFDPEQGIRQIKEDLKKCSKAIISYVPNFLVEELLPFFPGKDIRILMPSGERIHPDVKSIPSSRVALNFVRGSMKVYEYQDVAVGGICFPHMHYAVAWKDGKIIEIRTIEIQGCIRCMVEKHITAWSFGKPSSLTH